MEMIVRKPQVFKNTLLALGREGTRQFAYLSKFRLFCKILSLRCPPLTLIDLPTSAGDAAEPYIHDATGEEEVPVVADNGVEEAPAVETA